MAKSKSKQLSYISLPLIPSSTTTTTTTTTSPATASSLHALLLLSPSPPPAKKSPLPLPSSPRLLRLCLLFFLFLLSVLGLLMLTLGLPSFLPSPCPLPYPPAPSQEHSGLVDNGGGAGRGRGEERGEFWRQPEGMGYRPCLSFSGEYQRASVAVAKERSKYLMVVVSGGLSQQRNQIVDAVVIARILGAALVVPILQVNVIWGDHSEFSDIFDLDHFKKTLAEDLLVVSSLPSTHLMSRPVEEKKTPLHVDAQWIRRRYQKRLNKEGVLLLRGLDSRLSKDLPSDLQKLRCKVAFHALRFSAPILELGNRLAERMQNKGYYIGLHLRMEKDVWVRTGCLPGLDPLYDEIIKKERQMHPELLTARSNMTYHERKLAGLCPLNALDVARLLKALGAPRDANIYWAGGVPFGGYEALLPLTKEFANFYNKEDLSLPGELDQFAGKASLLAALDYVVCEKSDVFMPSHGGNMGHAIQGHRAYAGHKKHITPNKREMLPYFLDTTLPESEFSSTVRQLHLGSLGQPEIRTNKPGRDVIAYPVPECLCSDSNIALSS